MPSRYLTKGCGACIRCRLCIVRRKPMSRGIPVHTVVPPLTATCRGSEVCCVSLFWVGSTGQLCAHSGSLPFLLSSTAFFLTGLQLVHCSSSSCRLQAPFNINKPFISSAVNSATCLLPRTSAGVSLYNHLPGQLTQISRNTHSSE